MCRQRRGFKSRIQTSYSSRFRVYGMLGADVAGCIVYRILILEGFNVAFGLLKNQGSGYTLCGFGVCRV